MKRADLPSKLPTRLVHIIVFGVWLLPLTSLIVTRQSPFSHTLGKSVLFRVVIEALLPIYAALIFLNRQFRPPRAVLTWSVAAYAVAVQVTTILSLDPIQSWWGTLARMDGAFATLHLLALFLLLAGVLRTAGDWRVLFHVWLASSVVVAFAAVDEHFFQGNLRPGSTLGGPTFLATYTLFQIFFGVCVMVLEKSRWGRRWGGFCAAVNLGTLWLTATRGAMIGLGAGLAAAALALLIYERDRLRLRLAAALTLPLLIAVPAVIRLARGSSLLGRSVALNRLSAMSPDEPSSQTRLILLGVSWSAFKARPIRGHGPEMFLFAYNRYFDPRELTYEQGWFDRAHNKLADVAVMEGVIGLVPYLAMFAAAAWLLLGALRGANTPRALPVAALGMLVAYFVQNLSLFDSPMSYILFYSLLAFILSLTRSDYVAPSAPGAAAKKRKHPPSLPSRLLGSQRGVVAAVAVLMIACAYVNLTALAQAETSVDLADDMNDPGAFQQNFRQMLAYDAWPTRELLEKAADDLIDSGELKNPEFSSASRSVIAQMEARAGTRRELDPRFFITLGTLYNEQSLLDPSLLPQAETALKRAAELAPHRPECYDALGLSALLAGRTDAALALLKHAVDINPDNGQARWYYALTLLSHGHEKEGLEQLSAALPRYRYDNPRDLQQLAQAYYHVHELSNAVRFQRELVSLQPESAAQHATLAQFYKDSGDAADARREISIAVQLDPSYAAGAEAFIKSLGSATPSVK